MTPNNSENPPAFPTHDTEKEPGQPPEGFKIIPREWLEAGNPLPEDALFSTNTGAWIESYYRYSRVPHEANEDGIDFYATAQPLPCFMVPSPDQGPQPEQHMAKEQPGTHDLGPICGPHKGDPLSRQMLEKVIVAVMEEPSCPTCAGMNDLVATQGQRIAELELALATIGDIAVVDWDSETVGKVDALVKDPIRYRDQLRALFGAHIQLREICLLCGFDPSDGEGTSPEEVTAAVKRKFDDHRSLETAAQGLRDALATMQAIQARMTGDGPPLDMYYVSAANAKTKEALARFDALKEGK